MCFLTHCVADFNVKFSAKTCLSIAVSHFIAKLRFQQLPNLKIGSLLKIKGGKMGNFKKEILVFAVLALSLSVGCTQKKSKTNSKRDFNDDAAYVYPRAMALVQAAEENDAAKMRKIIKLMASVNSRDNDKGMTALMHVALENSAEAAKALIKHKADVNAKDNLDRTALMFAASENASDVAKLLIEAKADVNAKDYMSDTALMYAARHNAVDVAKLLIAANADINAKDNQGKTALKLASEAEFSLNFYNPEQVRYEVIDILKAAGAEDTEIPKSGI